MKSPPSHLAYQAKDNRGALMKLRPRPLVLIARRLNPHNVTQEVNKEEQVGQQKHRNTPPGTTNKENLFFNYYYYRKKKMSIRL